ncbi:MAG: cysteine desulfurase [Hyphomicrobiales bacterium]|nr:cysteine desulfurase [Hyphomicrobiales bacterium]
MNATRHYLDYNASAPLRKEARAAMVAALDVCGNPSSIHAEGRAARALVEEARYKVAYLCGARHDGVVFTSGATEALATALRPAWSVNAAPVTFGALIIGATEHACVMQGHGFAPGKLRVAPVHRNGQIDRAALQALLSQTGPAVVAIQLANNETGILQDMPEIAALVHQAGGVLVCDGVQAAGRIDMDMAALGIDALALSAHKLGGPKGVGALVMLSSATLPEAWLRGGGQERRMRGGTENVAGIAGFGAAAGAAQAKADDMRPLRDAFEQALAQLVPEVAIFGAGAPRLPNTSAFAIPGLSAQTALMALDLQGIALSSGSACSSGKVAASHVLQAMQVPPTLASSALRASFGYGSTSADKDALLAALQKIAHRAGALAA